MERRPRLIAALDVEDRESALGLAGRLDGVVDYFKLGSRLFTAEGPDMIKEISASGASIFLDLKFHDIPATVAGSVKAACVPGVDMMTIHTCGGSDMMRAAIESAAVSSSKAGIERPVIVGVTVLTSMSGDDLDAVSCYGGEVRDLVLRRAALAADAGLDGVVASVMEAEAIKKEFGDRLMLVTPGIRPAGASVGDQKRVATPATAIRAGSDYLVVGRPIYQADDPAAAAGAILREIEEARTAL